MSTLPAFLSLLLALLPPSDSAETWSKPPFEDPSVCNALFQVRYQPSNRVRHSSCTATLISRDLSGYAIAAITGAHCILHPLDPFHSSYRVEFVDLSCGNGCVKTVRPTAFAMARAWVENPRFSNVASAGPRFSNSAYADVAVLVFPPTPRLRGKLVGFHRRAAASLMCSGFPYHRAEECSSFGIEDCVQYRAETLDKCDDGFGAIRTAVPYCPGASGAGLMQSGRVVGVMASGTDYGDGGSCETDFARFAPNSACNGTSTGTDAVCVQHLIDEAIEAEVYGRELRGRAGRVGFYVHNFVTKWFG